MKSKRYNQFFLNKIFNFCAECNLYFSCSLTMEPNYDEERTEKGGESGETVKSSVHNRCFAARTLHNPVSIHLSNLAAVLIKALHFL